tara:strand:- start:70 stop:276 length:207 start_codon:yes stop_codon:yes gene_type:complete
MDIKAITKKYGITTSLVGGALVIGSTYGSCTVAPALLSEEPQTEEAPVTEEVTEAEEVEASTEEIVEE